MIDHVGMAIQDYARSKAFYQAALAPLGYELVMEFGNEAGFGIGGKPDFWIWSEARTNPGVHVAFQSTDRAGVRAFYEAAIRAGGKDNGPPGLRPDYHPDYYAAFVIDPDGHNIEAVCHTPE